jgi:hypothetical protein
MAILLHCGSIPRELLLYRLGNLLGSSGHLRLQRPSSSAGGCEAAPIACAGRRSDLCSPPAANLAPRPYPTAAAADTAASIGVSTLLSYACTATMSATLCSSCRVGEVESVAAPGHGDPSFGAWTSLETTLTSLTTTAAAALTTLERDERCHCLPVAPIFLLWKHTCGRKGLLEGEHQAGYTRCHPGTEL